MGWTFLDTWIIVTGALCAMSCALLGNYLVLRRMSMMGDAISHAVLPGLAVAFLLTGSRGSLAMLAGAVVIGILTAVLIQGISRLSGLDRGASMGVIFTTLFALGLVLIRRAADHVDLDPSCVLYGAIELTPLDIVAVAGLEIPQAAVTNAVMLGINALFVRVFFKELKITSFDPELATTMGINANLMHYALMTLVAATTIAAFESVGSILVIAMLIVPGATAHLLTDRLAPMIGISLVVAALAALLGHMGAITVPPLFGFSDTSTAGMMAVAVGVLFTAAFVLGPRYGLISRSLNRLLMTLRITSDDILGFMYRFQEVAPAGAPPVVERDLRQALKGHTSVRLALWRLARHRLVRRGPRGVTLTPAGEADGRRLIRSHRLWEVYLCDHLGYCETDGHRAAHRLEHFTDDTLRRHLDQATGQPGRDPHRRPIPGA